MKKILIVLIALLCFSLNPILGYAKDNGININTSIITQNKQVKPGAMVDLIIKVNGAINKMASGNVILNFDNTKFEYAGFYHPMGYKGGKDNCENGKVIYSYKNKDGINSSINGDILVTFKFKVKQVMDSTSNINYTLENVSDKDGNNYILSSNSSSIMLNIHTPSTNNYLSSITVSNSKLTPIFNKNTFNYVVNVDSNVSEIEINATKDDNLSNFRGIGKKKLNYGENNFDILVESEAGEIRQYKIKVNRKDNRNNDASLKNLDVTNVDFKFTGNLAYRYEVENNIDEVNVTALVNNTKSQLTGTGKKKLNVGVNNIVIKVTAENGTIKNYVVTIVRKKKFNEASKKSDNNYLKSLSIEGIDYIFDKNITEYELTVPYNQTRIIFNYEREDISSKVDIFGGEGLLIGNNSKTIMVVAENGAERQYRFNIIRKDNNNYIENNKEKILNSIKKDKIINVKINNNEKSIELDNEIIDELKKENKNIIFSWLENNVLQKELSLFSDKLNNNYSLNPNIQEKITDRELLKFVNGRQYIGINIKNTNIPSDSTFRLKLNTPTKDYLICYMEDGKVKSIPANIYNGYLELKFSDAKEYILVKKFNYVKRENKYMWVMPVLILTIVVLILAIITLIFKRSI